MPKESQTLYILVQYFMSLFFEKTYPISLTTLCVLTHWRFAVVFEDEVSLLPHTSLVLVTVALTICSMEDFQCLWKLFKDGLNLFQIYQERTLSLFFFCPPSFPFFLRFILPSYRKAKDYPLSPQLLRTFEYLLYYYFFLLSRLTQLLGLMCSFSYGTTEVNVA